LAPDERCAGAADRQESCAASLAPREALHLDALRLGFRLLLAGRRRKLLELQFQLVDEALAALGSRPELLALHLGDHQLQVFDQRLRANAAFSAFVSSGR
jgi:hypothetical protein